MRERWGTFSVIDHKNPSAFIPEILLYDRLVIPVPFNEEDKETWTNKGWEPDLLEERLKILGDVAVKARWDETLQKEFQNRMQAVKYDAADVVKEVQAVNEVQNADPYQMTRRILAQQPVSLPKGVAQVTVVAAYQSEKDFRGDFSFEEKGGEHLGLLLGQKIAIPDNDINDSDDKDILLRVIDLATGEDFKKKRRKLYEWQEDIIEKRIVTDKAIEEMDGLVKEYNTCVEKAVKKVYYNFAFTLGTVALGIGGLALGNPLAAGAAFIAATKFALLDLKLDVKPSDESKPAAMFHDIKKTLGWDII